MPIMTAIFTKYQAKRFGEFRPVMTGDKSPTLSIPYGYSILQPPNLAKAR